MLHFDFERAHVLEAKRFSENAPGVGKETNLAYIDKDKKLHHIAAADKIKDKVWRRYGPKGTGKPVIALNETVEPISWVQTGIG
jgi:hypothetical protein